MRPSLRTLIRNVSPLLTLVMLLSLALPTLTTISHAATPDQVGAWGDVIKWSDNPLGRDAMGKHDVLMNNGKILFWNTGDTARIWDPITNSLTQVPALFADLHCAAQVTLADGRVMVAGGVDASGTTHNGTSVTAFFDPATSKWTTGAPMHYERWYGTATTLPDGRVLVNSGDAPPSATSPNGSRSSIPEIYDPATDTWTALPTADHQQSLYPLMFVLPNGKAYEAGSYKNTYLLDYDGTKTWTDGPTNSYGTSSYSEAAVMYEPGKILRAGGNDPSIATASTIDMTAAAPVWKLVSPMAHARRRLNLPILADGSVMAVGGTGAADDETQAVYDGEIWNPATGTWTTVAPMSEARMYHSAALLLPDGRVLATGGETVGRLHAQIYSPPYLFKGARPTITASPSAAAYNTNFTVSTPNVADITSVALIRPSAVTHAFDQNQRYVPLTFSVVNGALSVKAPLNANYAPRGYYMLVIKNSAGVPSVASWVRMDNASNLLPGTLTGQVTNPNGNPVANAAVSYAGGSTVTNAQGNYTFSNVQAGEQNVTVTANGYATVSKSQPVVGDQTATLNFSLVPPGNITGTVTDSKTGAPITGATITSSSGTATTDSNGVYTLSNLASGNQELTASAVTYSDVKTTREVPANGTLMLNFALTQKPTYIAGEVRDIISNNILTGVTVSYDNVVATTDALGRYHLDAPPGEYTVKVSMDGYTSVTRPGIIVTAGQYTSLDINLQPINPLQTFAVVADAYVNAKLPTTNYGKEEMLRLIAPNSDGLEYRSYLRFNVSGLTRSVQNAKVRLHVYGLNAGNGSDNGGAIYSVADNNWNERYDATPDRINWNNAPAMADSSLSTMGPVKFDTWVEFDVTSAIVSNGLISFGLKSTSTNDVFYSSKEDTTVSYAPQLVIQQISPIPAIESFTATSGLVGTEVTITGQSFTGTTAVTFSGMAASSFTVVSDTQIKAVVPQGAGTGKISVTNAYGSVTSSDDFTVTTPPAPPVAPTIVSFMPTSGSVGTQVTIIGMGFDATTTVTFNGVAVSAATENSVASNSVIVDSFTQIRVNVPTGATNGKIAVKTSGGTVSSGGAFTVTPTSQPTPGAQAPEISGFTPASGPVGTTVTITGKGFTGATVVRFNGLAASSFSITSDSEIKAEVAVGTTSGSITVITPGGAVSSVNTFTVTTPGTSANTYKVFLPNVIRDSSRASTTGDFAKVAVASQTYSLRSFAFFCTLR